MKYKKWAKDEFFLWFTGLIVFGFFVAGIFDVLNNMIVKLILFSSFSFLTANIYFVLFTEDTKKSPEDDSE